MSGMLASMILCLACGQNLFNDPESVVFDVKYDRYLVSNCGDGVIVQVNTIDRNEGEDTPFPVFEPFNSELSSIRGMHIMEDILYVASDSGVVGFDLATAQKVMVVKIPEAVFLNDVTSDADNFLYVSDSDGNQIFKVDPYNLSYITLVSGGMGYPNGLLYDEKKNRLILCTGLINAPIYEIDPVNGTRTLIVKTSISYLDGLARDSKGNIYVTSWFSNSVYRFDPDFSQPPEKISSGHKGPADLCYNEVDNLLAVPVFKENKVVYISLDPHSTVTGR